MIAALRRGQGARAQGIRALLLAVAGGVAASLCVARPAFASIRESSEDEVSEYRVKAASLLHFISYTAWPKSVFEKEDSPIVVLVVGEDPFGPELEKALVGKKVAGRQIRVARSSRLEPLPKAHLIFLARSHSKEIGTLLAGPAARGVLVVGESEGLAAEGAHVNVYLESKRLRFEVNTAAVKRSELIIDPQMLKLARIVQDRAKRQDP